MRSSFLITLQPVDCNLANPVKKVFLKISRRTNFRNKPVHIIQLPIELLNVESSSVTSLKSDSTLFQQILKFLELLGEIFVVEPVFSIFTGGR